MQQRPRFRPGLLAAAVALALAGAAQAQVSTSTIKGQVSGATSAAGVAVTAVNKDTGATYKTTTRADGSYSLVGLAPGVYEIRAAGGSKGETVTLTVGETAALDLTLGAAQTITITGTAQRQGVRDSQVGTVVPRRLIETMPQVTRNFLSSADLAPGVEFISDNGGNTRLQGGSQNNDHVGVFIDGINQKNNILRHGVTGQDSSRGNPFPQSAIAEYRVISSNYKAEFDQVSSTAITAITRSGTNTLQGDAYIDRTGTSWRKKTVFEQENEAAGVPLPPSKKTEYGFALGGPIKTDTLHFFLAYDGKKIDDSRQFVPQRTDLLPNAGIVPGIKGKAGSTVDSFSESLLFGKLDAVLGDQQRLSLSMRLRRESDKIAEDKKLSVPGNDKDRGNDETRVDLKHEWTLGDWLSETRVGTESFRWNPHSSATSPMFRYKVGLNAALQVLGNSNDVAIDGGSPDSQDRKQTGVYVGQDLTFTGLAGHTMKGGAKVKAMKYELGGTSRSVDIVETLIDRTTGLPYYTNGACTGTNVTNTGLNSDQCKIDKALAPVNVSFSNTQFGLYIQDDWAVTRQLELNLGARYDYESNMLNNGYTTPADRVAALKGLDGRTIAGITAPAGQTYAQSLAKGGINIDDYIATGSSRKTYKGALAPRLGASYDVFGNKATVVFGGWGRSYDRTMANHALDELQKNKQAGGEIWLIRNEFKMPYADQFSVGLRQAVGTWNLDVTLVSERAENQFIWFGGNRDPNGGYGTQSPIDPLWGGPNGFGTLILGDFVGQTKTNSVLVKMEKPYSKASGWGLSAALTLANAKTTSKEWNDDIFDWTYGRPGARGWNPSTLVDKQRLVVGGVADNVLPFGFIVSGKATWASGKPRRITSCAAGWDKCVSVEGDAPAFTQFDLGVSNEIKFGTQSVTVRLDVLNLFNKTNYGGFDDWGGGPGNPQNAVGGDNANLGKPNSVRGDPRTMRLMLSYKF